MSPNRPCFVVNVVVQLECMSQTRTFYSLHTSCRDSVQDHGSLIAATAVFEHETFPLSLPSQCMTLLKYFKIVSKNITCFPTEGNKLHDACVCLTRCYHILKLDEKTACRIKILEIDSNMIFPSKYVSRYFLN